MGKSNFSRNKLRPFDGQVENLPHSRMRHIELTVHWFAARFFRFRRQYPIPATTNTKFSPVRPYASHSSHGIGAPARGIVVAETGVMVGFADDAVGVSDTAVGVSARRAGGRSLTVGLAAVAGRRLESLYVENSCSSSRRSPFLSAATNDSSARIRRV